MKKTFESLRHDYLEHKNSHLRLMSECVRIIKEEKEPESTFVAIARLNDLMESYMSRFVVPGAHYCVHAEYVADKNDHLYRIEIFDKDNRLVEELVL